MLVFVVVVAAAEKGGGRGGKGGGSGSGIRELVCSTRKKTGTFLKYDRSKLLQVFYSRDLNLP